MNIIDIITKKKDNLELSYDELAFAFNGYLNKEIPDYQMSSLLMAIAINGMNLEETYNLTDIFIKSGDTYNYPIDTVDKHSTGGIGDSVTLVIAPLLASLNIPIAKMSGKGLGVTGGTIDKLESIPGYNVNLSKEDYYNYVEKIGIALGAQTDKLCPLDKVIYALRDVTGTAKSIPLIVSSIMSKKIACGAKHILIDVKCGEGAFMKNMKDAEKLALWLTEIGTKFNRNVKTIITDMDEPLSDSIGNSLEVLEAIEILKGKECKLTDVVIDTASELISMHNNISKDDAIKLAKDNLANGKALSKFNEWIINQGGDLSKIKVSDKKLIIKSNKIGTIKHISALKIGKLSLKLGCGRLTKDSIVDYNVGIKLLKHTGDDVKTGDELAILYVNDLDVKLNSSDLDAFVIE